MFRRQKTLSQKRALYDAADADGQRSQTMRSNYLRGIVLSGFSLAVVNASKIVEGLRRRDKRRPLHIGPCRTSSLEL